MADQIILTLTRDDRAGLRRLQVMTDSVITGDYILDEDEADIAESGMLDIDSFLHKQALRKARNAAERALLKSRVDSVFTNLSALRAGGAR